MGHANLDLARPGPSPTDPTSFAPARPFGSDGGGRRPPDAPSPLPSRVLIEAAVAQVFGVHAASLPAMSRGKAEVAQARQVAMYLTHIVFGLNLTDTGRLYRRDRTTVAHACSVIEDLRDDAIFDRVMELLEGVVEALVTPRDAFATLHN